MLFVKMVLYRFFLEVVVIDSNGVNWCVPMEGNQVMTSHQLRMVGVWLILMRDREVYIFTCNFLNLSKHFRVHSVYLLLRSQCSKEHVVRVFRRRAFRHGGRHYFLNSCSVQNHSEETTTMSVVK